MDTSIPIDFSFLGGTVANGGRASVADMRRVEQAILLRVLRDQQSTGRPSVLSRHELSVAVGVSEFRIRTALGRLKVGGYIEMTSRFGERGAQLSNAMSITEKGKKRLADEL